jgi:cob(I)alamin adenosyltransferase
MKIYTKTGDAGKTSLIGGTRVEKDHYRIEAYGTMDELNSWIGMVMDQNPPADCLKTLEEIQDRLFTLVALAAEDKSKSKMKLPGLEEGDVKLLENEIDRMNESLPELKNFILPGGNQAISTCHIARCVCRRAERKLVALARNEDLEPLAVIYLNRLSDYLFVLSRYIHQQAGIQERPWNPRS